MKYLIVLALAQVLLTVYLLWKDFRHKKAEKFLLAYIITIGIYLFIKFFIIEILKSNLLFNKLSTPFALLTGPLIYLFVRLKLKKQVSKKEIFLHLLPFTVFIFAFMISWLVYAQNHNDKLLNFYSKTVGLLSFTSSLIYPLYLLNYLQRKEKGIKKLQWLKTPLWFLIAPHISIVFINILKIESSVFRYIGLIATIFVVLTILTHYLQQVRKKNSTINNQEEKPKYEKSGLTEERALEIINTILDLMKSDKMYLNPDLSLGDISRKTSISKHHLTEALNTQLGKNFYQFINEFRIEEVIRKIKKSKKKENLIYIAYDCGFNSKTTFTNYFKKIVGMTPSEYRKTILQ